MSLFPEIDAIVVPTPKKLSAGRRLTLRQKDDIAHGRHPLMLNALANNGETCGTCIHLVHRGGGNRTYLKCEFHITSGAASDCRRWWPACTRWQAQERTGWAWFAMWWKCECTILAATQAEIPSFCPTHGHGLLGRPERVQNTKAAPLGLMTKEQTQATDA